MYDSIFFDCDGVLLNSNLIKARSFYRTALHFYGEIPARKLYDYHINNCGVSRYPKFQYFLKEVVGVVPSRELIEILANHFSGLVVEELYSAEVAEGLEDLKSSTGSADWYVVSGGDQRELNDVLSSKGIDRYFEGGIYGSPRSKDEILLDLAESSRDWGRALFIGDSKYDHEVSQRFGMDFVFLSGWTNFASWETYCNMNSLLVLKTLSEVRRYV